MAAASPAGSVVVFGSLNVDSTSYVDRFPLPGETLASTGFANALGGKGTNQAVAAHRSGAVVRLVARVGADASGDFALASLTRLGLDVSSIAAVPDAPTGVAQITVDASGENTIVITAGANAALTPELVVDRHDDIAAADLVLTQGEVPAVTIERLAAACARFGTRFVLNLAPPVDVSRGALAECDPLVVNEHEARSVGIAPEGDGSADAWRAAAEAAVGRVARSVVITLGGAGAVGAGPGASVACAAPEVDAVDTTGAGDGFTGTLAAFLAGGAPLDEAVAAAVAAGALAVQRRGTTDSYATRDEILHAMEEPA